MVRIAVIDTNIEKTHNVFSEDSIDVRKVENMGIASGHGTAVCGIIAKEAPHAEITVFPIFRNEEESINAVELLNTLAEIAREKKFDIVNISNGCIATEYIKELENVCNELWKQKTYVICAFSNVSIASYPAAFDNVIGVDKTTLLKRVSEYIWVENSPVNILGYASQQIAPWIGNSYQIVSGNSFLCPHITAKVANFVNDKKDVLEMLKLNAKQVINDNKIDIQEPSFEIKKAVLFPYNKEMHAIVRFIKELQWEIEGVYETKYSFHLGKKIISDKGALEIKNIKDIDWKASFDTIIIGHVTELIFAYGIEYIEKIVQLAYEFDKNIYTYDEKIWEIYVQIDKKNKKSTHKFACFYPGNWKNKKLALNKMWMPRIPIVAVMGTNSRQGKYTTQLNLKYYFEKMGYNVAFLSTEPNGWLFDANATFHFGYQANDKISGKEMVITLNNIIHEIEKQSETDYDILITGSQSNTIPQNNFIANDITVEQMAFLHGVSPDAVVLMVSPEDGLEYICRTIQSIEAYVNTKVIAISIYPFKRVLNNKGIVELKDISQTEQIQNQIQQITRKFSGLVVESSMNVSEIAKKIEEYLSEG